MPSILVVDDEANIRSSLEGALGREGYQVESAGTAAEARAKLRESFDYILLDVWLPDGNGLDLLRDALAADPETVVIMMSGHATIDAAVQATRLGAFDFLEKPLSLERLLVLLRNAGRSLALQSENRGRWSGRDRRSSAARRSSAGTDRPSPGSIERAC